jgi:transposase
VARCKSKAPETPRGKRQTGLLRFGMAALCREFDVSRKTGYKIFQRYKNCGLDGLTDRSRRPYRHANQLPLPIEKLIVQLKRQRPSWGAPKIREKLRRLHSDIQTPAMFVKPYVQSNKNDANDAEAICEAMSRRKMRFVAVKAEPQPTSTENSKKFWSFFGTSRLRPPMIQVTGEAGRTFHRQRKSRRRPAGR